MNALNDPRVQALIAKQGEENRAREAAVEVTPEGVEREVQFLRGWAKGKPIRRQSSDSTFWAAGRYMTKLPYPMVEAIVAAGLGTVQGDPRYAGAVLTVPKGPKKGS